MTLKICTRCKQALPLSEFYQKTPKRLCGSCKACVRAREKEYRLYRASPEIIARRRAYRGVYTPEVAAQQRAYRAKNQEKIRERARAYRAAHPEQGRAYRRAYDARKRVAAGSHTNAEWVALCDWFGNICLRCGADGSLTQDHVIPFTKGGSDYIDNLQPLCFACNSAKQASETDYRDPAQLAAFLESLNQEP